MTGKEKSILDLIDKTSIDPMYQTIEVNGKIIRNGYSKCPLTWENIKKININFSNKLVYDLGCFNGYFSFKIMNEGAKEIIGIDSSLPAVNTYNYICELYNYNKCKAYYKNVLDCDFYHNKPDITLCLNMLHHVKRKDPNKYKNVLVYIFENSTDIIVEVNEAEIPDIDAVALQKNFKLITKIKSHRNTMFGQRHVMYYSLSKSLD